MGATNGHVTSHTAGDSNYQLRVSGTISLELVVADGRPWMVWYDGAVTVIEGPADAAALHGLLIRLRRAQAVLLDLHQIRGGTR